MINPQFAKDSIIICDMHDLLESVGFCSWLCNGNIDIKIIDLHDNNKDSISANLKCLMDNNFNAFQFYQNNFSISVGYTNRFNLEDSILCIDQKKTELTRILFFNGIIENKSDRNDNGRIKTIKLTIDNDIEYVLRFNDTDIIQLFELPKSLNLINDHDLRFEIKESYRGKKLQKVFITEIYFDGTNGHSFVDDNLYIWK